jgi:hypothetical protein
MQLADEATIGNDISIIDFQRRQHFLMKRFCNIWSSFFESSVYEQWRDGRKWTLCCYGESGCGKSTLAAAVAHDLATFHPERGAAVVVLFLDEKDQYGRKIYEMREIQPLLSLRLHILKQIMEFRGDEDSPSADEIYNDFKTLTMPQLEKKLTNLLDTELQKLSRDRDVKLYFIVDSLDRCPSKVEEAYSEEFARLNGFTLVTRNVPMNESRVKSCDVAGCNSDATSFYFQCRRCVSRQPFIICQSCYHGGYACVAHGSSFEEPYRDRGFKMRAPGHHIGLYVQKEIEREILSTTHGEEILQNKDLMEQIKKVISERSHGALVIARAWLDYLIKHQQVHELLDVLFSLVRPEMAYFKTIIHYVKDQDRSDREIALLSLQIISKAIHEVPQRHITYMELNGALKLQDFTSGSQANLLRVCQGSMCIADPDQTVVPFHPDFGVYLYDEWLHSQDQLDMAEICLRSIWRALSRLERSQNVHGDAKACFQADDFLTYALQSWGFHFARLQTETAWTQVMLLMNDRSAIDRYTTLLCLSNSNRSATLDIRPGCQPTHLCAFFGIADVLDRLQKEHGDLEVDAIDTAFGRTALIVACEQGQAAIVRRLLHLGADTTLVCKRGHTAISIAIELEYDEIFDLLLSAQRCSTSVQQVGDSVSSRKALCLASKRQNPYYLQSLLQRHHQISNNQQISFLTKCLVSGHLETLKCLVGDGRQARRRCREAISAGACLFNRLAKHAMPIK